VEEWVVTDSTTHDLDFVYQLTDTDPTGTGGFDQVTVTSFPSSLVTGTESFASGYGATGTVAPSSVGGFGGAIDFNFDPSGVVGGQTTYDLVVLTNATTYGPGSILVQDGGQASIAGYAPTPEPGSVGLLLGGLFGLGLFVRRFRMQQS
jgi:hypothetical protein